MTTLQACSSGFPESRYIVLKESDLYEAGRAGLLSVAQLATLVAIKDATETVRRAYYKAPLTPLIIEKDWPEYQPTLELLAARVLAEINSVEEG